MPILDRYICWLYAKIFLICFVSFVGLYVVIDAFTNLEELLAVAQADGGLALVLWEFYGPRVLQIFDRTAPFIALVAAIFAIVLMQRSNETTAIQAGGVSYRRIARPLLVTTIVIVLLSMVNREIGLPLVRDRLVLNAQDLARAREHAVRATIDPKTGIVIRGKHVKPTQQQIAFPEILLPDPLSKFGDSIVGESGTFVSQTARHESGYLLKGVEVDDSLTQATSQILNSKTVIYRPGDTPWLEPDQVLVVTDIDTLQLAFAPELMRYAPLPTMIQNSRQPSSSFSNRQRIDLHGRIVQPAFDLSILLIGLPLVVARRERGLLLSVGLSLLIVVVMLLSVICFHALGASRIINPPALATWLPLMVFLPFAVVTYQSLER